MIPLNQNLSALKRSQIRVFTNLAKATPGCAMLTIGEPDLDTPEEIKASAVAALMANHTHYAPNQGTLALRQAVADFESARGHEIKPEQVLITIGACQALFTALFGILNPGEEVVVPTPGFGLYESIAIIAGAKAVPLDVSKTGFQITEEALASVITEKTKAIVINSPCNPTGVIFSEESLAAVKAAVRGKPIFIICDNVYHDLSYGPCPDYVMKRLLLLSAATITAVPTFLQEAAVTALHTPVEPMREIYRKRRAYVCGRLRAMGLDFPEPEGAFYVFVDIRKFGLDSETFCTRMIREGLLAAVPGACFGAEGYLRLSYCYGDEELKTGLDRLERFIQTL